MLSDVVGIVNFFASKELEKENKSFLIFQRLLKETVHSFLLHILLGSYHILTARY